MATSRPRYAVRVFVLLVLGVTFLFPLLAFFSISRSDNILPAPATNLPFQSTDRGGRSTAHQVFRASQRAPGGCACRTAREEEADRVIQMLETQERSQAFEKVFLTDFWGGGESRSGPGSRIDYTANVRRLIAEALKTYSVHHLLDAPCGDVNWQPLIEGFNSTKYTGYDIVPQIIEKNTERFRDWQNMDFARMDFVNTPIALKPDLIVCRDGIQHNSLKDGIRGFVNLESTGAKYLVSNWHTETGRGVVGDNDVNVNIQFGGAYPINVFTHPFNFSHPDFFISEGVNGQNADGKLVGLWKLPALWKGDGKRFLVPESLRARVQREVVSWADVEEAQGKGDPRYSSDEE